jgi:hypothetical protein
MDDELKRIRLNTALAVDKVAPPLIFCCCSFYLSSIRPAIMPVCPIFSRCLGAREAEIEESSSCFCVPRSPTVCRQPSARVLRHAACADNYPHVAGQVANWMG